MLDAALARFVEVPGREIGFHAIKAAEAPGAAAARGVGFAAIAALAASRRPGVDVVLEFTGLAARLAGADLVITGEGSLDKQSLLCKTPMGVARAAAAQGVPVVAVRGRTLLAEDQATAAEFEDVYALTELESNVDGCIAEAGQLLEAAEHPDQRELAADELFRAASTKEAAGRPSSPPPALHPVLPAVAPVSDAGRRKRNELASCGRTRNVRPRD